MTNVVLDKTNALGYGVEREIVTKFESALTIPVLINDHKAVIYLGTSIFDGMRNKVTDEELMELVHALAINIK